MKKYILLILALVLIVPVYGKLNAEIEFVNNNIYLDENAIFNLKLENTDDFEKVVKVYSPEVTFYVQLEPSITRIGPGETIDTELRLIPSVWAKLGAQSVEVYVESIKTGEKISMLIPIYIKSFESAKKDYAPSIELNVDFNEEADFRDKLSIDVYLRNRNWLDIENLDIIIKSKLFEEQRTIPFGPREETNEKFVIDLRDMASQIPPQEDTLEVSVKIGDRTISKERIPYEVISYSEFVYTDDPIEELFKKSNDYVIKNVGNIKKRDSFTLETTFVKKQFTRTNIKPVKVDYKKGEMIWLLDLAPDEEVTLHVEENYRPLIYVFFIIIIVFMLYFIYRSPLMIKKETIVTGRDETSIQEIKVLLHVRNRSQSLIEPVTVIDTIPSIASLVKEARVGSLSPSKVLKHQKKGTLIRWEIESLDPFEERIITYKIKSKIAIVGSFSMPQAKIKFEAKKGRERVVKSNKSTVSVGL